MKVRRRPVALGAVAAVGLLSLSGGVAWALWSDSSGVDTGVIQSGAVYFQVAPSGGGGAAHVSVGGEPVTVSVPGSVVGAVLSETTVVWPFEVSGYAMGMAGINYSLTVPDPEPGTLREQSTSVVYPAALNGDCSDIPDDQLTVSLTDATLQPTSTNNTGKVTTATWCVAITFHHVADGTYANAAVARATASDTTSVLAITTWTAPVQFPVVLDPLGFYQDSTTVVGKAADGLKSRDTTTWNALVVPQPDQEPSVDITIDPYVVNPNPAIPPGDHATLPTPVP